MNIFAAVIAIKVILLFSALTLARPVTLSYENAKEDLYSLYDNCGMPADDAFKGSKEELYFKLNDGYQGGCRSDAKNRRERMELRSGFFRINKPYRVSFHFKLKSNQTLRDWHSIFQIKCTRYGPPVFKLQAGAKKQQWYDALMIEHRFSRQQQNREYGRTIEPVIDAKDWKGQWNKVNVDFLLNRSENSFVTLHVNNQEKSYQGPHYAGGDCYLKFGLYRNSGVERGYGEYGVVELLIKEIDISAIN
jgi:hypothetical protein